MHLATLAFFALWLHALLQWAHRWGLGRCARVTALVLVAAHASLMEPRMWAAANNAVAAAALGAQGSLALLSDRRRGRVFGALLIALGILARADAVLWVGWTWIGRCSARTNPRVLIGTVVLGALALFLSVGQAGRFVLEPSKGLTLVGGVSWPWQGVDPRAGGVAVVGMAIVAAFVGERRARPPLRVAALMLLALFTAGSLSSWAPSGRYLVVGVAAGALALVSAGRWGHRLALALAAVHVVAVFVGSAPRALREQAAAETALYRAVREFSANSAAAPLDEVVVLDPPPLGWTADVADLENIVSAAARRIVRVRIEESDGEWRVRPGVPVWRWVGGRWESTRSPL